MSAVNWMFRNRETGQITIAQFPNTSLWLFIAAVVVRAVWQPSGGWRTGLDAVATIAAVWWAGDEVVRGVNPWRRLLGGVVLAVVLSRFVP